jgi:outer membrane protein
MRRFSYLLALGLILVSAGSLQAQQVLKIGYLDSGAILRETPGAAEAQEQFQADLQQIQVQLQAQVQQMQQEIEAMIQAYEAQRATLTDEARQQREAEIGQRQAEAQQQLQQLNAQAEVQAGQRQQQLVQPIMDRINTVVDDIRREGNYSLIFDLAAGAVLAADPALDLTSEVIRRLQLAEGGPGGSGGSN